MIANIGEPLLPREMIRQHMGDHREEPPDYCPEPKRQQQNQYNRVLFGHWWRLIRNFSDRPQRNHPPITTTVISSTTTMAMAPIVKRSMS